MVGSGSLPHSTSLPRLGTGPLLQCGAWEPGRGLSQALKLSASPPASGSGLCGLWETLPALAGEPGGPQQEITVQPGRGTQWALTKYLGNAASSWQIGRGGGGRQLLSSPSQVAEVRGVGAPSPGVPTWLTHGWQAWFASSLPASCLQEQGWPERERAARIPCHPPTHTPNTARA